MYALDVSYGCLLPKQLNKIMETLAEKGPNFRSLNLSYNMLS